MSLLSPGVEIIEIDASQIAPTVSNSIACFAGDFDQGPVGVYMLITNEDELITYYGKPTLKNYNDWMQAQTFLKYGNKLFVSRAANTNGSTEEINGLTVTSDVTDNSIVPVTGSIDSVKVGDYVAFGNAEGPIKTGYVVMSKSTDSIELDRNVLITVTDDNKVYSFSQSMNSVFDALEDGATPIGTSDYIRTQIPVLNYSDFENKETSIMMNDVTSKLKLIAKNPGNWGNDIEVAIANSSDFGAGKQAFEGISLDDLFEYYPISGEFGIVIRVKGEIEETFTVSFDPTAKDQNNKSLYVESVLNTKSNYVFAKDNTGNANEISSYIFSSAKGTITLVAGTDSPMGQDDLINAYEVWDNKEDVDVDIVIANEFDSGLSAKSLVDVREDCIAFIGANYSDCVGQKAAQVVSNLVAWRKTGSLNYNDMFVVAGGNYVYQYNKYLDKNVWINVAGHMAGLRAQTNTNRASWWASAGLDRGQLKDVIKLAFNPDNGKRDILYKNGINPIVSFAGQGIVMWGQKTLLDKASSSNNYSFVEEMVA
jgi:phage tail sheath protein FI